MWMSQENGRRDPEKNIQLGVFRGRIRQGAYGGRLEASRLEDRQVTNSAKASCQGSRPKASRLKDRVMACNLDTPKPEAVHARHMIRAI